MSAHSKRPPAYGYLRGTDDATHRPATREEALESIRAGASGWIEVDSLGHVYCDIGWIDGVSLLENDVQMGQLTADDSGFSICVRDARGGVWWPGDVAGVEIEDASDSLAAAVRICHFAPMRGEWCS
jgi:uncharacterized protein YuzE